MGEALGSSLSRIADADLFAGLAQHYRSSFDDLQIAIGEVEKEFKVDPDVSLSGIDLWGGVDQVPLKHPLDGDWVKVRRCDGKSFEGGQDSLPLPASIRTFDYAALRPLMIASNLSLSKVAGVRDGLTMLGSCVAAR